MAESNNDSICVVAVALTQCSCEKMVVDTLCEL